MKKMHFAATAALLAVIVMSCSKNDNDKPPTNPSSSKTIDESQLKAKWEMTSHYNIVYDKATGTVKDATGVSQTYHENGVGQWDAAYTTYMTFNNDYTFDHSNADGTEGSPLLSFYIPRHGQWQLRKSNEAISFEIIPVSGQTEITYDVAAFSGSAIHLIYTDSTTYDDATDVHHLEFKR